MLGLNLEDMCEEAITLIFTKTWNTADAVYQLRKIARNVCDEDLINAVRIDSNRYETFRHKTNIMQENPE